MTDNDAEKAFNGCRTNTVLNGNMVVYYIPLQQEEKIRTALAKSAKVGGILDALEQIRTDAAIDHDMLPPTQVMGNLLGFIEDAATKAIQRFNGEV